MNLSAQKTIDFQGVVSDSIDTKGISFATVCLLDTANNSIVYGTITDSLGRFNIENIISSQYTIAVSSVGYNTKRIPINFDNQSVNKNILLSPKVELLNEFTIEAKEITKREEIDKTVYKIDNFTLKNSTTALDALRNIPQISIKRSDETIKVNGSTNVLVLIDGSYSNKDLRSISPEDIERVEVITNPSAEFDSEIANVINVILKEERKKGLKMIFTAGGSIPDLRDIGRLSIDFEFSKFRFFTDYNYSRYVIRDDDSKFDSTYYSITDEDGIKYEQISADYPKRAKPIQKHDLRYGIDFRISEKDLLNFTGYYSIKQINYANYTNNTYFVDGNSIYEEKTDYSTFSKTPEQNYTLYYRHRFNRKGHELSINTNVYTMSRKRKTDYNSDYFYTIDSCIENKKLTSIISNSQTAWNTKLKYDVPVTKNFNVQVGAQTYLRKINYHYDANSSGEYFKYHDTRIAGFTQAIYKITDNFSITAGIRIENLNFNIYDSVKNSNISYLPNITAMLKINSSNKIKINYREALTYPSYHFLSPFTLTNTDSLSFSSGNPNLLPETERRLRLDYSYIKDNTYIQFMLYILWKKGIIGERYNINGAITNTIYDNIENAKKYGGLLNLQCMFWDIFMPEIKVDLGYSKFKNKDYNGIELSVFTGFELELPWDMTLEVWFSYYGYKRRYNGYDWISPIIDDITLSKSFLKNKANISISLEECLLAVNSKFVEYGNDYYLCNWDQYKFPIFFIKFNYVFQTGDRKVTEQECRESLIEREAAVKDRK